MSLILRKNLTEALSHQQLDGNFEFLYIEEWVAKSYEKGRIVYIVDNVDNYAITYLCTKTHNITFYDPDGEFTQVVGNTRIWVPLGHLDYDDFPIVVSGNYDSTTEQITLTKSDGSEVVIDIPIPYIDGGDYDINTDQLTLTARDNSTIDIDIPRPFLVSADYTVGNETLTLTLRDGTEITTNIPTGSGGGAGYYIPSVSPTTEMQEDHGGLASGTTAGSLSGETFSSLFDEILFPTVYPTFVDPTVGMGDNVSNVVLAGGSITLIHSPTFNPGSILEPWNNNNVQDLRAGDMNSVTLIKMSDGEDMTLLGGLGTFVPVSTNVTLTYNNITHTITPYSRVDYSVDLGRQSFRSTISYNQGPIPIDSVGGTEPGDRLPAGSENTSTLTFEGVWPIYVKNEAEIFNSLSLYSFYTTYITFTISYIETSANRHEFDVPDDMITLNGGMTIQALNPVSGSYDNLPGGEFTTSTTTKTINGITVDYTRYTKASPLGGSVSYRLAF